MTLADVLADALGAKTLRLYHGCRTADVGEYLRVGVRVHQRKELIAAALARAAREGWPGGKDAIEERSRQVDAHNVVDNGRSCAMLDDRALLTNCSHYLLHGSEFINAVLGLGERDPLNEPGVPTVLELDVPGTTLELNMRRRLATDFLFELAFQLTSPPATISIQDTTINFHRDMPASWIVDHYHPDKIRDPRDWDRVYQFETPTCAACAGTPRVRAVDGYAPMGDPHS